MLPHVRLQRAACSIIVPWLIMNWFHVTEHAVDVHSGPTVRGVSVVEVGVIGADCEGGF
jgi:hypothetical protein